MSRRLRLGIAIGAAVGFWSATPSESFAECHPNVLVPGEMCSDSSSSSSDLYAPNGLGARLGTWIHGQITGEGRQARATELNNEGVRSYNAGDYDRALDSYREAFSRNPNSLTIRSNLIHALIAVARRNHSAGRGDSDSLLREARGLMNTSNAAALPDYNSISQALALVDAEQSQPRQSAENERQLASASRDISGIARDLGATLSSDSRRSARPAGGLGFGDPSVAPNLNPGAQTQEASAVAAGQRRQDVRRPSSNLDAARRTLDDGGATLDGGQAHDNCDNPITHCTEARTDQAPASAPASVVVSEDLSAEQLERYNSSPAFVTANAELQRERQAFRRAQARDTQLRAQSAATSDLPERQRIQIEISNNSQELTRAQSAQRRADEQRQEVMQVIEGAPIVRGSPPPAQAASPSPTH